MKLELTRHILINTELSDFMKIRLVGAELFHAGGRTGARTDGQKDRND